MVEEVPVMRDEGKVEGDDGSVNVFVAVVAKVCVDDMEGGDAVHA